MCGICGVARPGGVREDELRPMLDRLVHRGPDDEGTHVKGAVGLGFRRLSIIDLEHGAQPMPNEDESTWVVFNGEIYNFEELRTELLARGHRFRTRSDTEVLVHLYEEHGTDCVRRLRGMFAFAIWDHQRERLFAARDRLGQKPFFYTVRGDEIRFASEIKALLAADPGLAELDPQALDEYLALRVVTPPRTMFRGVRKLPPAHTLTFSPREGLRIERYWELVCEPKLEATDEALLEELEDRLVECLRLHMIADVPVGAFLSGGLDSTLVVALLAQHVLHEPLETFSGSLRYRDFDEAPYARMVAERYGTRHHERAIEPSLIRLLPRLVEQLDEPSDPLSACTFLIAALARERVKVVLGGDGGDELFGGYDRYYGHGYASRYAWIPAPLRRAVLGPALHALPAGGWYKSRGNQLRWLHELSFAEGGARYARSLGYFYFGDCERRHGLYTGEMARAVDEFDPGASIAEAYEGAQARDPVDRMICADSRLRLPDHSVMILDRMTMAHGLEARSPFLDHELFEFSARLPGRLKVRGRELRRAEVRLAERYLPPALLERPKQGFSSALPYMLRAEYERLFDVLLRDLHLARDGVLRPEPVRELLAEHRAGRADHANRLWLLVNAEAWYRVRIEGVAAEALEQELAA